MPLWYKKKRYLMFRFGRRTDGIAVSHKYERQQHHTRQQQTRHNNICFLPYCCLFIIYFFALTIQTDYLYQSSPCLLSVPLVFCWSDSILCLSLLIKAYHPQQRVREIQSQLIKKQVVLINHVVGGRRFFFDIAPP
jgi:hypothetical protein